MAKAKRAAIGFKGITLAPVKENTVTIYKTEAGVSLPYAGGMTRTAKESSTDLYYDDELYTQIKDSQGEEVEIRVAEVDFERLHEFGLGEWDAEKQTFEGEFSIAGKEYSMRFVVDTLERLPYYFNYRVFEMNSVKFDNFTTKKESITVCEVVITGIFKKPQLPGLSPWAVMQLKEDKSNQAACSAFLTAAEEKPVATP